MQLVCSAHHPPLEPLGPAATERWLLLLRSLGSPAALVDAFVLEHRHSLAVRL
jgi:hypothetical protein